MFLKYRGRYGYIRILSDEIPTNNVHTFLYHLMRSDTIKHIQLRNVAIHFDMSATTAVSKRVNVL